MPLPATAAEFLALTRQSSLLPDAIVDRYARSDTMRHKSADDMARQLVVDGHITLFQANHLLKGKFKNFFVGKYKVLMPIGAGGASQVFLCEHATMRHRVALKMLRVKDSLDPGTLGRFIREARAAATVNHPNVVRAYDFDKAEDKHYYIVLDYVDGVSLEELVANIGPLPAQQAVNYIVQTATGLQHIHECGLIHRDIKPSNLLLDRTGLIRITDLGLVRFTEADDDNLTKLQKNDHTILGTADYLSPEQALKADDLDIRSDIYSLGVTLYFLLSGETPFANLNIAQKLLHHQFRDPPNLESVPKDLFQVLLTMMAKKPGDRYQTPDEVVDVLSGWMDAPLPPPDESWFASTGIPSSTPSNPRRPPAPSWVRTSPTSIGEEARVKPTASSFPKWWILAVLAAAIVVGVVVAVIALR